MKFDQALRTHFRFFCDHADEILPIVGKPHRDAGAVEGRVLLARMMGDLGYEKGVEIGVKTGASTLLWLNHNPKLHMTCIDPWTAFPERPSSARQEKNYQKAVNNLKNANATVIRASGLDVVDDFEDGSLDFVNIDGDHRFDSVVQDIIKYVPKVRKGGMILVHDYNAFHHGGVRDAVDAYTRCHRIAPWFATYDILPTAFWEKGAERC